ncbi:hypothetical protein ABH942_002058 [Flavobacterium sp. 28YEA47A]
MFKYSYLLFATHLNCLISLYQALLGAPSGIRTKNFTPKTLTAFPLPQPEKAAVLFLPQYSTHAGRASYERSMLTRFLLYILFHYYIPKASTLTR